MVDSGSNPVHQLVAAILAGQTDIVETLLAASPALANEKLPGNDRSMLHHATDWPGNRKNIARTIELLIAAGADLNVAMPLPDSPDVAETPLHWAASSGDIAAATALLDAGATVDVLGGIFGGCTPYEEAIIFEKYEVARLLVERGAANYLPGAAALGRADLVEQFFHTDGTVRLDVGLLPNWETPPNAQVLLDRAFQFACRAGHLDIAKLMHDRGANPASVTPGDTTALAEATNNGHEAVIEWLRTLSV